MDKTIEKNYKRTVTILFYLVIISLIITPNIKFIQGIPSIRIEDILIVFLLLYLIVYLSIKKKIFIGQNNFQLLLAGFLIFITLSMFIGSIKGYNTSFADFNQFTRVVKYLIIYTLALTVIRLSLDPKQEKIKIINTILNTSLVLFFIVAQQYFNVFNLNNKYVHIIAPTKYQTLVEGYSNPRPVGMFGNPNELAFLFVITILISLYIILNSRFKYKYIVILLTQITGMLFTGSRGAFMASVIGSILLIISMVIRDKGINIKFVKRILPIILLLSMIVMLISQTTGFIEEIWWRYARLDDLETDTSWQARISNWKENINIITSNPLFGVGPLRRESFEFAADNEWLLLLRSYGLMGTIYLLLTFLIIIIKSNKDFKKLTASVFIAAVIFMIPAAVFHSLVLFPLMLIILSLTVDSKKILTISI